MSQRYTFYSKTKESEADYKTQGRRLADLGCNRVNHTDAGLVLFVEVDTNVSAALPNLEAQGARPGILRLIIQNLIGRRGAVHLCRT